MVAVGEVLCCCLIPSVIVLLSSPSPAHLPYYFSLLIWGWDVPCEGLVPEACGYEWVDKIARAHTHTKPEVQIRTNVLVD
jgi:hypothetical protein